MITLLATLCHMATVSSSAAPIEFCQEQVVARLDVEETACYMAAQQMIAPRLMPGYRVKEIRCASDRDGRDRPRDSI